MYSAAPDCNICTGDHYMFKCTSKYSSSMQKPETHNIVMIIYHTCLEFFFTGDHCATSMILSIHIYTHCVIYIYMVPPHDLPFKQI